MGNYRKFKKELYAPNALSFGGSRPFVSVGSFISFRAGSNGERALGRVLGLARGDGMGKPYVKKTLAVLQANDMLAFGYLRHVPLEDVLEVREPGAFSRWFLFGEMPEADLAKELADYGSMCNAYIERYLSSPEGAIRKDWREYRATGAKGAKGE